MRSLNRYGGKKRMSVRLNTSFVGEAADAAGLSAIQPEITAAHEKLHNGTGAGNAFLGWVDLPVNYDRDEFARIKSAAEKIKSDSEILIVIGIGGSYLGARAAIEFVKSQKYNDVAKGTPKIYFAGNTISSSTLAELIDICKDKDFSVNVISKSGTTTEPALAFRIFRDLLIKKYGKDGAKSRIYATTDKSKGALRKMSDEEGYETFVVPDNVGGRYSVLTAVGLLPIAVAGIDIDALMKGAADAREQYMSPELDKNDCYRYAAIRNILYRSGKKIEMMAAYEPDYAMMCEWFKQLFGESEGKEHKGIFPASAIFSTDLHSLGQYIQQGERSLFETVVTFASLSAILLSRLPPTMRTDSISSQASICPRSTARRSRERCLRIPTAACPTSSWMSIRWMSTIWVGLSTSSRKPAEFPAMSSESIRSTSPALKVISSICSHSWASPDMRSAVLSLKTE